MVGHDLKTIKNYISRGQLQIKDCVLRTSLNN